MTKLEKLNRQLKHLRQEYKVSGGTTLATSIEDVQADVEIEKVREHPVNKIRLRKAIRSVMEYNWEKEEDDYRAHAAANADPSLKGHIFKSLVILETWLKRGW